MRGMQFVLSGVAAAGMSMAAGGVAQANLLSNPGFEDFVALFGGTEAGGNDADLDEAGAELLTNPVTVDAGDANFQNMVSRWGRGANGNWTVAPSGSENGSWAVGTRKTGLTWFQVLALDTISAGDDLYLDWQYFVDPAITATVTNEVVVFGVNQAEVGEAPTTITTTGTLGGETHNSAILGTSTVTAVNDGVWHDAPQTLIQVEDDWDYVGIYFKRTAGLTNSTGQHLDNFSLTLVPEPAALGMLGVGLAAAGLRRRR